MLIPVHLGVNFCPNPIVVSFCGNRNPVDVTSATTSSQSTISYAQIACSPIFRLGRPSACFTSLPHTHLTDVTQPRSSLCHRDLTGSVLVSTSSWKRSFITTHSAVGLVNSSSEFGTISSTRPKRRSYTHMCCIFFCISFYVSSLIRFIIAGIGV